MFKFPKQPISFMDAVYSACRLYGDYGWRLFGWSLLFGFMFEVSWSMNRALDVITLDMTETQANQLMANIFIIYMFIKGVCALVYLFCFSMLLARLFELSTNQKKKVVNTFETVVYRMPKILVASLYFVIPVTFLSAFYTIPGWIFASLMIFIYPLLICENATMMNAMKGTFKLVYQKGGTDFFKNWARSFGMFIFPICLGVVVLMMILGVNYWLMPFWSYISDYIYGEVHIFNQHSIEALVVGYLSRVIAVMLVAPLSAASIIIIFRDLKYRINKQG